MFSTQFKKVVHFSHILQDILTTFFGDPDVIYQDTRLFAVIAGPETASAIRQASFAVPGFRKFSSLP